MRTNETLLIDDEMMYPAQVAAGKVLYVANKSANEQIADRIVRFVNRSVHAETEFELWCISNGIDDTLYRQQLINIQEAHLELLQVAKDLKGEM